MWGFVPVPKPVCGAEIDDLDGITHTCKRAASSTGMHIHRDTQIWWFGTPFSNWVSYFPLKAQRKADLATLTHARHQLDRNTTPEDHDELNDAVIEAEKRVLFGKRRGWKYEART